MPEAEAACLVVAGMAVGDGGSCRAWAELGSGFRLLMVLFKTGLASGVPLRLLHARCANLSKAWRIGEAPKLSLSSPCTMVVPHLSHFCSRTSD